jgi:hypothetical protein
MVLGNLESSIDIRSFSAETPNQPPELSFDIHEMVREEDWSKMMAALDLFREHDNPKDLLELAKGMKLAFPERAEEFEKFKDYLHSKFRGSTPNFGMHDFSLYEPFVLNRERLKFLYPDINISDNDDYMFLARYVEKISSSVSNVALNTDSLWLLVRIKLLFPEEYKSEDLKQYVNDDLWHRTEKYLNGLRDKKVWFLFIDIAARAAMLFSSKYKVAITPKEWAEIKSICANIKPEINLAGSGTTRNIFIETAGNMRLLTAKKVEIANGKLEVIYPSGNGNISSGDPPFPTERTF